MTLPDPVLTAWLAAFRAEVKRAGLAWHTPSLIYPYDRLAVDWTYRGRVLTVWAIDGRIVGRCEETTEFRTRGCNAGVGTAPERMAAYLWLLSAPEIARTAPAGLTFAHRPAFGLRPYDGSEGELVDLDPDKLPPIGGGA